MGLQAGIVGLPNVGKSTLFNCLSNAQAQSANFPFCTIEPNIGTITVPDSRLFRLEELVNPQRVIPTTIEIVDIAGLVKGASKGEGLGNQFLGNIKSTDAIIHVVRCFENDNIVHVDGSVDPVRDKEIIDTELQLKDLDGAEKALLKYQKMAKTGDKVALRAVETIEAVISGLSSGNSVRNIKLDDDQKEIIQSLQFLTAKPVMYVCNVDENSVVSGNQFTEAFAKSVEGENALILFISAAIEADIATMDRDDQLMFLEEMGLTESGVGRLIRSAYELLNYITYFTAGEKEVRAWTITRGTKAPGAAGVIHTDFEKGFIRAEVIHFADFDTYGSESKCRDAGRLHVEGKDYVVQDGDVMHFRFNV
ncbi:MAG: redox-regulated ATPase YchF [Flavobacteriales bacterium]|nr:redox-regulated ATPase YchF [Bacteroidota bacterium]MCB9239677.1 redox-regulated ATPase YchF [Flavobacteriales bacterium]